MGRHKIDKVKVNKEFFMDTVHKLGSSIRKLGAEKANSEDDDFKGINRDEKTIRRDLNSGEMPPDLLDRIAKDLNVDPDYLSGKIAEPINKIDDEDVREYFKWIDKPEFFPYREKKKTVKYIQNIGHVGKILDCYGVSTEQLDELTAKDRIEMCMKIDEAMLSVIKEYFVVDSEGNSLENIYKFFINNYIDIYQYYAELEHFDVFGPNIDDDSDEDPFAEKYKDISSN